MFLPYNTDAPIYYFPFGAIALIVINVLVFVGVWTDAIDASPYVLDFGDGLHPVQWITSDFLHVDIMHLLGNMLFLWTFGLVVEGKLGWFRFVPLYLIICALESAADQLLMLGADGGFALGASGAITALMTISLVWAPYNNIEVAYLIVIRPGFFEVSIISVCAWNIGWDIFFAYLSGFAIGTPMLHLIGAAVGLPIGLGMLMLNMVDCEGWDIRRVWREFVGADSDEKPLTPAKSKNTPTAKIAPSAPAPSVASQQLGPAKESLQRMLQSGEAAGALALHMKMKALLGDAWQPTEGELLTLIKLSHDRKAFGESIPVMVEYLKRFPEKSIRVRLRLAQILVQNEQRGAKALDVLAKVPRDGLPDELRKMRDKLEQMAQALCDAGDIELASDEEW